VALCGAAMAALIAYLSVNSSTPKPPAAPPAAVEPVAVPKSNDPPPQANAPSNVYIGRDYGGAPRTIHTIFTTRKKAVLYQALVRYEPVKVSLLEVPAYGEVQKVLARQGKDLPQTIMRIDQETEMSTDNLGEPLRFVTGYKMYLNPLDGRVIAYDMAQTTGGQPQRMVGHVTRNGMAIEVYRGGQLADKQEVTFVRDTFIPVEYDFIHQWFELPAHRDSKLSKEQVKFSIFVPEAMAQVLLVIRPLEDEVIPIGAANYNCARYEVLTVSTQSAEGLFARQDMWFDKSTGLMMKRQDFDATLDPGDAPVTEREPYHRIEQFGRLSALPVDPPTVPFKSLDTFLDHDFDYSVKARDHDIGHVRVRFSRFEPGKSEPSFRPVASPASMAFFAEAQVRVDTGGSLRDEKAVTLYDGQWRVLNYETRGEESAGTKLTYKVSARIGAEKIHVSAHRDSIPELKFSMLHSGAVAGVDLGSHALSLLKEAAWHDPLKRVPLSDEEAREKENAEAPRLMDQSWTRALPAGTFVSDYNRVEHLALLACRLPLPPPPTTDKEGREVVQAGFQKAALYLVRQNRCGVLLFETRPEYKPKLTERQKRRLSPEDLNEPPLYTTSVSAAMMPCKMLLAPDGRILQLDMKYGAGDVTYTLDDPIMRRRAERARAQKLQEGPRIVRPPWW
jgi:hypothetical protein